MRSVAVILSLAGVAGCASLAEDPERRVTYSCERGDDLTVVYDDETARIIGADGSEIVLPARPAGSGFWYESPTHSLRGQGTEVTYTIGRMAPIQCQQNNTANM